MDREASLLVGVCERANVVQRTPECKHIDLPMGCLLHHATPLMVFGSKLITHDEMINLVSVPLSVRGARPYAVLSVSAGELSPVCLSGDGARVPWSWLLLLCWALCWDWNLLLLQFGPMWPVGVSLQGLAVFLCTSSSGPTRSAGPLS